MDANFPWMRDVILDMESVLAGVAEPAMVSRDLHDIPGFGGLTLEEAASVLVMARNAWGTPTSAQALFLPLATTTTLQTAAPDITPVRWNEATLYRFNPGYLSSATLDLQRYQTPVGRLADRGVEVLVTFQCARPVAGIEGGWEFSSDLLLTVAPEVQIRCL